MYYYSVVYHEQKKYKKRFFVAGHNVRLYTLFLCILCCLHTIHPRATKAKSSKNTSQQKKYSGWFPSSRRTKKPNRIKKRTRYTTAPYANTPIQKLNEKQLEELLTYVKKHSKDPYFLLKVLDQLVKVSTKHEEVKAYKLELADLHYQLHHIDIAALLYEDFATLYPSSIETEYCSYKAVICMFDISLDFDRDQTNTETTIKLATKFLEKATNQDYKKEVETIKQTCFNRLFEKELYVLRFYLKKQKYGAVQIRLTYIKKNFADKIPNFATKIKEVEDEIAFTKNPKSAPAQKASSTQEDAKKRRYLG